MNIAYWLVIGAGVLAILYGLVTSQQVLAANAGNERMQQIASAIQEGARAYLNRQYTTIAIAGVVIFVILFATLGWHAALGLLGRRGAVGCGRLYRNERLGARQCADRAGRARRARRRARTVLQGGRDHRYAGRRPRHSRRLALLHVPACDAAGRRSAPDSRIARRTVLRRLADLDLRASRRRHLHQGRRCRRRSRRQGRSRYPGR